MALIETSVSAGRVSADQLVDRKTGEAIAVADIVNSSSGDTTVTSEDITDATEVGKDVLTAATQAAARAAIGAGTSNLAIGTTATTAMAGNKTPTTTQRGGVLQQPAISDLTSDPTMADYNALLAALRAAGIIAAS